MMSRHIGIIVSALLMMATQAVSAATVIKDGKEWMQPIDAVNISWNTMATYCDTATGICDASTGAGGTIFEGWTWASVSDMETLFDLYISEAGETITNNPSLPGIAYQKEQDGSTFVPALLTDFTPTDSASPSYTMIRGLTRESYIRSNLHWAYGGYAQDWVSSYPDRFQVSGIQQTSGAHPTVGVWMYRDAPTYSVGGNVSGLIGTGLQLQNSSEILMVAAAATTFTFVTELTDTSAYAVTISAQPTGQTCSITSGSGSGTIAAADVTNVAVVCMDDVVPPTGPAAPIPTMSVWGLGILISLMGLIGFNRRRKM